MPPDVSLSLPNTPLGKTTPSLITPNSRGNPRKAPCCTKCKRPRVGHPRQGCPFLDLPTQMDSLNLQSTEGITNALGSMNIASPVCDRDEDTRATIRNRRSSARLKLVPDASLASLSTFSSEIVARVAQPGILCDDEDDEGEERVIRWREGLLTTPTKTNGKATISPRLSVYDTHSQVQYRSIGRPSFKETPPATEAPTSTLQPNASLELPICSTSLDQVDTFPTNKLDAKATVYFSPDASLYTIPSGGKHCPHSGVAFSDVEAGITRDGHHSAACPILGKDDRPMQGLHNQVTQIGRTRKLPGTRKSLDEI